LPSRPRQSPGPGWRGGRRGGRQRPRCRHHTVATPGVLPRALTAWRWAGGPTPAHCDHTRGPAPRARSSGGGDACVRTRPPRHGQRGDPGPHLSPIGLEVRRRGGLGEMPLRTCPCSTLTEVMEPRRGSSRHCSAPADVMRAWRDFITTARAPYRLDGRLGGSITSVRAPQPLVPRSMCTGSAGELRRTGQRRPTRSEGRGPFRSRQGNSDGPASTGRRGASGGVPSAAGRGTPTDRPAPADDGRGRGPFRPGSWESSAATTCRARDRSRLPRR
jgi:hypothetical protein